jgi:hypothetical protein
MNVKMSHEEINAATTAEECVKVAGYIYSKTTADITPLYSQTYARRRRIGPLERDFVWKSTEGKCYICQKWLPPKSDWHIEHVVAYSFDPESNDVLGNMLPACATCNLRKNDKSLVQVIQENRFTNDLLTAAASVDHLNAAARATILRALTVKHERISFLDNEYTAEKQAELVLRINQLLEQNQNTLSKEDQESLLHDITRDTPLDYKKHITLNGKTIGAGGFGTVFEGRYNNREDPDFPRHSRRD